MRTALSRMAAKGEVNATDDGYELAGALIERQRLQDAGRRAATPEWDGRWLTVTPLRSARSLAERRDLRRRLERSGFGELRPDFWLRPANVELPEPNPDLVVTIGELVVDDRDGLISQLWPLADLDSKARALLGESNRIMAASGSLNTAGPSEGSGDDDSWLVDAFTVSAGIVRFLMREPRLPPSLVPQPWSPDLLRGGYNELEVVFQQRLAGFLRARIDRASAVR